MTDWSDTLEDLFETQIDAFGEVVLLPDGQSTLNGIFSPVGESASAPWSEIGLDVRLSEQVSPSLRILSTDAPQLDQDDVLTIRGARYSVTRLRVLPDLPGTTRVELMPEEE